MATVKVTRRSPLGLCLLILLLSNLAVAASTWQQGFDFRNSSSYVMDPSGDTYVLSTTAYPTKGNGVTYGWVQASLVP